jgi:hypothetical protein
MSIYRNPNRTPPNEILDFAEDPTKSRTVPVAPDDRSASRRKAAPTNLLLNTTAAWVESLPHDLQPKALCGRFPRIANALSSVWSDAEMTHAYFADLFYDVRGRRQGLPEDVLCELLALRARYESEHLRVEEPWQDAG